MDEAFWQAILDSDCAVPEGYTVLDLAPELVADLASTDPRLREALAGPILATWIERGGFTADNLRGLAMHLVMSLSTGLGETKGDGVFLRAASVLALSKIVARDNKRHFFSQNEVENLFLWSLDYLKSERDLRGYVGKKGWAYALAQTAELLAALARNRHLTVRDLETLLMAIADKLVTPTGYTMANDEDDRLVAVVWVVLQRQLVALPFLTQWLARCIEVMIPISDGSAFDPNAYAAYQNMRRFLRSLYFRLEFARNQPELNRKLQGKVLEAIRAVRE
jgi:hypothetical protein